MIDPSRAYYRRQIESAASLSVRAVQRELERLASIGFLYRRQEGSRVYYQVDTGFALFDELRALVLKMATAAERLRGSLAMDEGVRLAFLNELEGGVLIVAAEGKYPTPPEGYPYNIEVITSAEFLRALPEKAESLEPFLVGGVDVLGRRDDVIWHHIEMAGYKVSKGQGVP